MRATALAICLVVFGFGCTKVNPKYCAGQISNLCDAGLADAPVDRGVAVDASDAADAPDAGDGPVEVAPEAKPLCSSDNDCNADGGAPACGTSDGGAACVECTMDKHCSGTKAVCDPAAQTCVECTGTDPMDCKGVPGTVCNAATKTCVECVTAAQCTADKTKPVCDSTAHTCRGCAADSECTAAPGICVDWDKHCAAMSEVAFVDRGGACDVPSSMFCSAGAALGALTPDKRIVLISGNMPVGTMTVTGPVPSPILIVGRGMPSVTAGGGDNADIAIDGAHEAYVRDIKLTGPTTGVLVFAGATLHLTRATVVGNLTGGVYVKNGSFEITNSIIAANGQGDSTGGVFWAGARLGDVPAGGLSRFESNTVVDNIAPGVSCAAAYAIVNSIVHGNSGAQTAGCNAPATPCCGAGDPDPALDATYHLESTSPCIDQIAPTMTTLTVDIDGQARPHGPKLDCGADEFVPPP